MASKWLCLVPPLTHFTLSHCSSLYYAGQCSDSLAALVPYITSLQFSSVVQLCPTLCKPMDCSMPGLHVHHQLLVFTQTHVLWVGDAIQSSHPLSSPSPPAFSLSQHHPRVFSNQSALCIRWPKYWSFSFNISPSNEHPALISFRVDWLDLLAIQGTHKSLLQHHSTKACFLYSPTLTSIHDH